MSELKFACPHCGQHIASDDTYAGQAINCPACQRSMQVPGTPPVAVVLGTEQRPTPALNRGNPPAPPPPGSRPSLLPPPLPPSRLHGQGVSLSGSTPEYWRRRERLGIAAGISGAVIVLAVLLTLGLPALRRWQATKQAEICARYLTEMHYEKRRWAGANQLPDGTEATIEKLGNFAQLKDGKVLWVCPSGGRYTLNAVGVPPECSVPGHALPARVLGSGEVTRSTSARPRPTTNAPVVPWDFGDELQWAAAAAAPDSANPAMQERLEWTQHAFVGAYGRVGRTNAAWDVPARAALEEAARLASGLKASARAVGEQSHAAVEAGCDDPLVQYLHTRFHLRSHRVTAGAMTRACLDSADRLTESRYGELHRFDAALYAANQFGELLGDSTRVPVEVSRYRSMALTNALAMVRDRSVPVCEVSRVALDLLREAHNNKSLAVECYRSLEKPLFENWPLEAGPLVVKGEFMVQYAWMARGAATADQVSQDGWKGFEERLQEAAAALEQAWKLDPKDARSSSAMITVEMGQGQGRTRMETWFRRAMDSDPNNYYACTRKLLYLEPKWHGTAEDVLVFARQCTSSTRWGGAVPLTILQAHQSLSSYYDRTNQAAYWRQPTVWRDVKAGFERFLERNPDAIGWRHNYAAYTLTCGQWQEFSKQVERLGASIYPAYFGGEARLRTLMEAAGRATAAKSKGR